MKWFAFCLLVTMAFTAFGDDLESVAEKGAAAVKELKNDTGRAAKNVVRKVKEEKCKLENKNTECLGMKAKHAIQKGADEIEDALD